MNPYKITDKNGKVLCFQVGKTGRDAVISAKDFYGHNSASHAEFIRKN